MYHVLKAKSTTSRTFNVHKRLLTVPKSTPNIYLDTFGKDPTNRDFMSFNVCDTLTGEILCMFRAENIVQQRNFMAALGGKGPGLFTQNSDDTLEITMLTDGPATNELFTRQQSYDNRSNRYRSTRSIRKVPSYVASMVKLSREFYLPEDICQAIVKIDFPGEPLPKLESVESMRPISPRTRRPENDTFLPPHGEPLYSPVSLGYGNEVGLEPSQQAVWVPQNNFYYFLDHDKKTSFLQDPRPPPSPVPVVAQKHLEYNAGPTPPSLQYPHSDLCTDATVIAATAERAATKPAGFVLNARGINGTNGSSGLNGLKGDDGENGAVGIGFDHAFGADGRCGTSGLSGTAGQLGNTG